MNTIAEPWKRIESIKTNARETTTVLISKVGKSWHWARSGFTTGDSDSDSEAEANKKTSPWLSIFRSKPPVRAQRSRARDTDNTSSGRKARRTEGSRRP